MNKILLHLSSLSLAAISFSFAGDNDKNVIEYSNGNDKHVVENKWDAHRPDSHAPIGVMGDHTHEKGETMISYRVMYMDMGPNYIGSEKAPLSQILGPPSGTTFPIIPTEMQTQMQSIGIMHAPTDNLTLTAMFVHVDKSMQHTFIDGSTFRTHSSGIGDFKFGGLLKIYDDNNHRVHLNLVTSAPTGSVDNDGFVPPAGGSVRLPYPMQLGSGTWDLMPGITWLGQQGDFSYGAQAKGTVRLGENDESYTFGNEFMVTGWTSYRFTDFLSASFRGAYKNWGNVDGADPNLNPLVVPTARPDLRGGERIDLFGGMNYYIRNGALKGHRLAVEAGGSVYQNLDGPQLGMDWSVIAGWQKAF